jgi:hypothetical protein
MLDRRPCNWIALLSAGLIALGMGINPLRAQEVPPTGALKSAKERLSDKASDEQRVNNCHVPPEKRGTKPRPDCPAPQKAEQADAQQKQGQ